MPGASSTAEQRHASSAASSNLPVLALSPGPDGLAEILALTARATGGDQPGGVPCPTYGAAHRLPPGAVAISKYAAPGAVGDTDTVTRWGGRRKKKLRDMAAGGFWTRDTDHFGGERTTSAVLPTGSPEPVPAAILQRTRPPPAPRGDSARVQVFQRGMHKLAAAPCACTDCSCCTAVFSWSSPWWPQSSASAASPQAVDLKVILHLYDSWPWWASSSAC